MLQDLVGEATRRLSECRITMPDEFDGCNDADILSIQTKFELELPKCYCDFLRAMGRGAGSFLVGTDFTYPDIMDLRESAECLLAECGVNFRLPANAFVFADHGGYNFVFFYCDGEDDPPTFLFVDSYDAPMQNAESFSEWLTLAVEGEIEAESAIQALKREREALVKAHSA